MTKIEKYWIEFWHGGRFFAETTKVDCAKLPNPFEVEFPEGAFCFTMHKRTDVHNGYEVFTGKAERVGPKYYHPMSLVVHIDRIRRRALPSEKILLSNMEINGWDLVIQCHPHGNFQPFDKQSDIIIGWPEPFIAK